MSASGPDKRESSQLRTMYEKPLYTAHQGVKGFPARSQYVADPMVRSPAASNRLTGPALASCRVGEKQPQRHHRDTADPKSKPFAEYVTSARHRRHPPLGVGQAKA